MTDLTKRELFLLIRALRKPITFLFWVIAIHGMMVLPFAFIAFVIWVTGACK